MSYSNPFRPIGIQQDYLYLTKLQRVNHVRNSSAFVGQLESIVHKQSKHDKLPQKLKYLQIESIGVLPSDCAIERQIVTSLCRLLSVMGYSECITDTFSYNVSNSTILTTPFGVLWSCLKAYQLISVKESGASQNGDNLYGYNTKLYQINGSIFQTFPNLKFIAFLCSPIFVATSLNTSWISEDGKDSIPGFSGISVLGKNNMGGIDFESNEILELISYSNPILFIAGLGVLICSQTAEELFFSVKKLANSCQNIFRNIFPIKNGYKFSNFQEWATFLDDSGIHSGRVLMAPNVPINPHNDVKIPPFITATGKGCQGIEKFPVIHFTPLGTNVNEFRAVHNKIKLTRDKSASTIPVLKDAANDQTEVKHKGTKRLLSKISMKWLHARP